MWHADDTMASVTSYDPTSSCAKRIQACRRDTNDATASASPSIGAFERIVTLCSVRDRSRAELEDRLEREGYTHTQRSEALERAERCGLVDNNRFADAYIRARVRAGKGPKLIRRDLAVHGIDVDDVAGWPHEYGMDEESLKEQALTYLKAHPPRGKDLYAAACRKLESRGYPSTVTAYTARSWLEQL